MSSLCCRETSSVMKNLRNNFGAADFFASRLLFSPYKWRFGLSVFFVSSSARATIIFGK